MNAVALLPCRSSRVRSIRVRATVVEFDGLQTDDPSSERLRLTERTLVMPTEQLLALQEEALTAARAKAELSKEAPAWKPPNLYRGPRIVMRVTTNVDEGYPTNRPRIPNQKPQIPLYSDPRLQNLLERMTQSIRETVTQYQTSKVDRPDWRRSRNVAEAESFVTMESYAESWSESPGESWSESIERAQLTQRRKG